MMQSRIFVHGLKAHADEMWASALLIASKPDIEFTEIIRDANRIGEASENDFILDCGMKFDGIRFFDHHQLESCETVDCALTLIAKTFAPWVFSDQKFSSLIERVRVQDNFGIPAAEQKFGKSASWLASEFVLIGLFEKEPLNTAKMLAGGFVARAAEIREIEEAGKWIESNTRIEFMKGGFKMLVCESSPFKDGFSINGFNAASTVYICRNKVNVVYGWATDGSDARTLFRTRSGNGIDFTKSAPEHPVFCHKGGFLLIFNPETEFEYRKLVLQAADQDEKSKESA